MNKNLHRIIFNAKRGQLMVVAETACAQGKDAGGETAAPGTRRCAITRGIEAIQVALPCLQFAMAAALGWLILAQPVAHAQIIADPAASAGQRPTVLQTANGLPQVNIQTPSAAGVSRNTYSQFDVNRPGVILNNSRSNTQTQLGGFVAANPWLATGGARVILNQVNSNHPSQLRGYVEVAGQRAEVIIANPAGINIDGGGFLNASRVTLTTGSPVFSGANLDAFRVQGGNISVNGAGLDTSSVDYTAILARAVQVNAGVWGKDLRVVAGANVIDTNQLTTSPVQGTGSTPNFSVDVAQLGGMYAGKIFLIGTESGLGVRNAGVITATAGDLVLQANGWLTNSGTLQAAGNLHSITQGAITNTGTVYASGNTALAAQGSISISGAALVAALGSTSVQATGAGASINATAGSVIAAGLHADGSLATSGDLSINAQDSANLQGQTIAGGNASVNAGQIDVSAGTVAGQNTNLRASSGNVEASRSRINASGTLSATAFHSLRTDSAAVSANQLEISAQSLSNRGGEILQTGTGDTLIALTSPNGILDNTQGRIAVNSGKLSVSAQTLVNTDGKLEHAGKGTLAVNATTVNGERGNLLSSGGVDLTANAINHRGATLSAEQVTISAASLDNRNGTISQTGTGVTRIIATGAIDNTAGKLLSNGATLLQVQTFLNQGGIAQATGVSNLDITATGALDNSAGGQIAAGGTASLTADSLNNALGKITAGGALTATVAGIVNNSQGMLASNGAMVVTAARVDNTKGTVASVQGNASLRTNNDIVNDSGRLEARGNLTLASAELSNTHATSQSAGGTISGRDVSIDTRGLGFNNNLGTVAATHGLTVNSGALNNDKGLLQAGGALNIATGGQTLTNTNASQHASGSGGITAQGGLTLTTGNLDNAAGFIGGKGAVNATTSSVLNTQGGMIVGEASVSFTSTAFDNQGGQVQAIGDLGVSAAGGTINNAGGLLCSAGTATLTAFSVINTGTLGTSQGIEGQNLALTASTVANDRGAIRADNNATLTLNAALNNDGGLISAGNAASVLDTAATPVARALAMSNSGGTFIAGQRAVINAASAGGNGRLLSRGTFAMSLKSDFTNTGEIASSGNASVSTTGNLTNSGKLQSGGALDVSAANIDNASTGEITGSTTRITATNSLTNRGLIDGQTTEINAATLTNIGTGRIYGDTLSIAAVTLNNSAATVNNVSTAATIAARQRLDIGANTVNNTTGALIFSAGDLAIGGALDSSRRATGFAGAVNNSGGTIESLGSLSIAAGQINNTNPDFAYTVQFAPGANTREYITAQGIYTHTDVAWVVLGDKFQAAHHGGYQFGSYPNAVTQAKLVLVGNAYANPVYQSYYSGANAFTEAYIIPGGHGDNAPPDIYVPISFSYEMTSPAWQVFGIAPPTAPFPGARPAGTTVPTEHGSSYTPPTQLELDTWAAAAAPWLALQAKIETMRASVNASGVSFDGFRDYNQATPSATITQSTPGRIVSAGNMTLNAQAGLLNDQSQIIAGGALNIIGQAVENRARVITVNAQRTGTAYAWGNYNEGCGSWFGCDYNYNAYRDSAYVQDVPKTFDLNVARSQSLISPASQGLSSGTQLATATTTSLTASPVALGAVNAAFRSAGIAQVTSSVSSLGGIGGLGAPVIRTSRPDLTIPNNSLFRSNPSPTASFLIETDPRFANFRNWLGSDYMLASLSFDPAITQKRLGDGFYEQRLVREQVALLTGQRFLGQFTNDEAQYQALMDAALTLTAPLQLRPGIALTATQMAALTSDIVWLVEQEVTLADGSRVRLLVPQVYVRVQPGDLDGTGTLIAGRELNINLTGDLTNSGTLAGRKVVSLTAENVQNLGSRITGDAVSISARNDLNNIGGQIDAANSLLVMAGRDINIATTTSSATNRTGGLGSNGAATADNAASSNTFSMTGIDRVAVLYVTNPGGILVASAGRDLNVLAGIIGNNGTGSSTTLAAGNNINLGTVTTSNSSDQSRGDDNFVRDAQTNDVGSQIQAGGNLSLVAGNDLNARAATVQATGDLTASAGNDINLTAGRQTNSFGFGMTTAESDLFSSTSTKERRTTDQDNAAGSSLGGNTVTLISSRDTSVQGSSVIGDTGTTVVAGRNITIEAAQNTSSSTYFFEKKESGLLDGDGFGITIGVREQSNDQKNRGTTAAASTVGAISGNVILVANDAYKQVGSDVLAPAGDITIAAKTVEIVEARETNRSVTEQKFKQSGLTLAITAPVITALQTAQQMSQAAGQTSDGRMQALAAGTTALAAKNAYDSVAADPAAAGGLNISITVGSSQSQSTSTASSNLARGSTVAAGGDVSIVASSAGKDSDILVRGSTVQAGNNATLIAEDEIKLLAAANNSEQNRSSSGSSGGIGVAFTVGSGGVGFGITANASASKGKGEGQDTSWTNTRVEAGKQLNLLSGGDTTLKGAVAKAEAVMADVGGNLNIESLQDTSTYRSKDQSLGGSVTVGIGFSGSVNVSQQKINSDFASVMEQSGIKAGDGGFQVNVQGNTDLKGAVIASTDKAMADGKNTFTTGTLTQSEIQNKAEYSASSLALGGGYSDGKGLIPVGGQAAGGGSPPPNNVGTDADGKAQTGAAQTPGSTLPGYNGFSAAIPIALSASGNASSTTSSGISSGAITISDEQGQHALTGQSAAQVVASIDTNVRSDKDGGNALKPIFNEQEIKAGFEIVGALSRETGTFLANRVKEADAKAAQAKEQDRQADEKMTQAQILPDGQEKIRLIQDAAILKNQAAISRIEAADIESKWGAGGDYRQVMTAITAAAGGNISADGGQFVQSIMLNLVQSKAAEGIKTLADDLGMAEGSPAHAALHTLSACAGAAAQGSSCGAAAFGAATASVVSSLLEESAEVLTSEQKEARKNLIATLVTGVAAANGQAAAANTAALIEMENNSNAKNAVKAAINDAKDYVGKKGKEGLEKAVELLEKIEIKPLVEKQKEIGKFLDEAAARGGLTEGEIAVLGIIYAANEALFPTSALDLIPGAGKAVGKTGMLVKAGMKAEDAAKVAIAEAKAAAQAGNYGKVGGHDVHAQAGANGGAPITSGGTANSASGLNLGKALTSEQQLLQLNSGGGSVMAGSGSTVSLRDAPRLAAEYGGAPKDWSKISSGSYTATDGTVFEIHAYRNAITGQVVEPKTIQPIALPGKKP